MIIVTGGAGFIGSNIVKALNKKGDANILVVDNLSNGAKYQNLADCDIADYMDKEDFLRRVLANEKFAKQVSAIFHEGACSSTTEWNGQYMMRNNYEYSKSLLHYAMEHKIPFLYASSAATYGNLTVFKEERRYEAPVNVYGYSKFLFDQYVRNILPQSKNQIVGFRYFNVYGPREQHKAGMASVAFHLNNQILKEGVCRLFEGTEGYANGEQRRDFVYVEDVANVNLWFMEHQNKKGIFNLGTGRSQTFNDVAHAVIAWHQHGKLQYIPFPDHLKGHYQSFTEANLTTLRNAGYQGNFKSVEEGVKLYLDEINAGLKKSESVSSVV